MTVYKPYEAPKTGNDEQDTQNITLTINQIIEFNNNIYAINLA